MATLRELLSQEAEPPPSLYITDAFVAYARALVSASTHETRVEGLAKAVDKAERELHKAQNDLRLAEHVLSALLDVEVQSTT